MLIDGESIVAILAPGQATVDGRRLPIGRSTPPASTSCPAVSTCTPTCSCRSAAPRHRTRSKPGTRAAAWGGVTTIVDFAVQKTGESVQDTLAAWHEKAAGECAIDYGFHQIIGGVDEESLKAMTYLVDNEGITSFKMFMAYPEKLSTPTTVRS